MTEQLPSLVVFDVNETLSDLSPLRQRFTEVGLAGHESATWFASLLRDGFALTASGDDAPFATVARESLRAMLTGRIQRGQVEPAVAHVMEGLHRLGLHGDVVDGVHTLRAKGLRLVTLSNGSAAVAAALFDAVGLRPAFESLLSVEDSGRWKPAREAYDHALTVCGVQDPEEVLLVAVHPWDIHGAHRAGLRTAWIDRSGAHYPTHFVRPDLEASSLTDLAARLTS